MLASGRRHPLFHEGPQVIHWEGAAKTNDTSGGADASHQSDPGGGEGPRPPLLVPAPSGMLVRASQRAHCQERQTRIRGDHGADTKATRHSGERSGLRPGPLAPPMV